MRLHQLMEEVAALGFTERVGDTQVFLFCANRALRTLAADRPTVKTLQMQKQILRPVALTESLFHRGAEALYVQPCGNLFSFLVSGTGEYTVYNGKGTEITTPFHTPHALFRDTVKEGSSVVFRGEYDYTIRRFCSYRATVAPDTPGVCVEGEDFVIGVKDMPTDFLTFDRLPEDDTGEPIAGATLNKDTLRIPAAYEGGVRLCYRVCPTPLYADDPLQEADVPKRVEHLLPLLCAAYLWMDDEPQKAQCYMQMYENGIRSIAYSDTVRADVRYTDVLNWT